MREERWTSPPQTGTGTSTPCWLAWPWRLASTGSTMNRRHTCTAVSSQVWGWDSDGATKKNILLPTCIKVQTIVLATCSAASLNCSLTGELRESFTIVCQKETRMLCSTVIKLTPIDLLKQPSCPFGLSVVSCY